MPYIVMRRSDIPEGTIQYEDLRPNTSQKNSIYEPGLGQTGYVRPVATSSTVVTSVVIGEVTTLNNNQGLGCYLLDTVEDSSGTAILAAEANATATALILRVTSGLKVELADVDAALITAGATAGTGLTAGASTGTLAEVLEQLMGAVYELPYGSLVQTGGVFVPTRLGSFAPDITIRRIYDTGFLHISAGEGKLSKYLSSSFTYLDTSGAAVVIYTDTGTLFVP
jgi:hypothetical protein